MKQHLLHLVLLIAVMVAISACDNKKTPSGKSDSAAASAIDSTQLAPPAATRPSDSTASAAHPDTSAPVVTHTAVISTSMGDITVDLYGKDAPKAVENFVGLTKKNYYDGTAFHRVIPKFMIQGGDPNSRDMMNRGQWGMGGESIFGKTFEDELDPNSPSGKRGYTEGTLAMANSGPNTNGSQFFIVLTAAGAQHLTYNYTIFGHVRNGMDIAHKIEQTGMTGEMPVHPAIIKAITVKEGTK